MYARRTVRQLTKVIIITKKTAATIAKQSVVPDVASRGSGIKWISTLGYFGNFGYFGYFQPII